MSKTKKHKNNPQRRARPSGWSTSDADEIERRRLRGINEAIRIESQTQDDVFFGVFQTHSGSGRPTALRYAHWPNPSTAATAPTTASTAWAPANILRRHCTGSSTGASALSKKQPARGSPYIEIFLDRRDHQIRIRWPSGSQRRSRARDILAPFFVDENILAGEPLDTLPAMERAINAAHTAIRRRIRVSGELNAWLESLDRRAQQLRSRQHFEAEVTAGNASLDVVKHPLYPYQQEGMLHLAFTGRALLADEMGLGKTVQAIAACELLRRTLGIRRVLVISPASLKGEWEEQIAKFTDLPARIIQGPRAHRLRQYDGACVLQSGQL